MCDHCAKSFGQALDLREHIQMIHKGQPLNLKCKHCDKTFHSRKARLRHVNLDHFPDRCVDSSVIIDHFVPCCLKPVFSGTSVTFARNRVQLQQTSRITWRLTELLSLNAQNAGRG